MVEMNRTRFVIVQLIEWTPKEGIQKISTQFSLQFQKKPAGGERLTHPAREDYEISRDPNP